VWRVCHAPVNGTATNPRELFNGFRLENGVNTYLKKDDADEDANTYIYDECKPQGVGIYESDLERYEQIGKVAQISTVEETTGCVMYANDGSLENPNSLEPWSLKQYSKFTHYWVIWCE
jgi:hypothetical protein